MIKGKNICCFGFNFKMDIFESNSVALEDCWWNTITQYKYLFIISSHGFPNIFLLYIVFSYLWVSHQSFTIKSILKTKLVITIYRYCNAHINFLLNLVSQQKYGINSNSLLKLKVETMSEPFLKWISFVICRGPVSRTPQVFNSHKMKRLIITILK